MERFKNRQRLLCLSQLRDSAAGYVSLYTMEGVEEQEKALLEKSVEQAKALIALEGADKLQLEILADGIKSAEVFVEFALAYEKRGQRMAFMRLCQAIANRNESIGLILDLKNNLTVAFDMFIGEELLELHNKKKVWCGAYNKLIPFTLCIRGTICIFKGAKPLEFIVSYVISCKSATVQF